MRPVRRERLPILVGRVIRLRPRADGGWRIRLAETGGALAAAEIPPFCPLPLPPVGARILMRGRLRYDEAHAWYAVDPLDAWVAVMPVASWGSRPPDAPPPPARRASGGAPRW